MLKSSKELDRTVKERAGYNNPNLLELESAQELVNKAYIEGYCQALQDLKEETSDLKVLANIEETRWQVIALTSEAYLDTKYKAKVYAGYRGDCWAAICYYHDEPHGYKDGFKTIEEAKEYIWAKLLEWKESRETK